MTSQTESNKMFHPTFFSLKLETLTNFFAFFTSLGMYASSVDKSPLEAKVTVLDLKNSCLQCRPYV